MGEPENHYAEWKKARHKRLYTVGFHLCEMCKKYELIETENRSKAA